MKKTIIVILGRYFFLCTLYRKEPSCNLKVESSIVCSHIIGRTWISVATTETEQHSKLEQSRQTDLEFIVANLYIELILFTSILKHIHFDLAL